MLFLQQNSNRKFAEVAVHRCSSKLAFLKMFTGKHLCWNLFWSKIPTHVFSCEYNKIFKNSFFYRTPLATVSPLVAFQMHICNFYIILNVYKSSIAIISFQREKNVYI